MSRSIKIDLALENPENLENHCNQGRRIGKANMAHGHPWVLLFS